MPPVPSGEEQQRPAYLEGSAEQAFQKVPAAWRRAADACVLREGAEDLGVRTEDE